jgi:hypothetical protein
MARSGTPLGGRDEIAERVYVNGADFTLVAYTNTPDSLGDNTVAADLVQPTVMNGYAPITLNGVWATSSGIVTYDHGTPDDPGWTASGPWSAPVTGVALISGSRVVHFKDYNDSGGSWTAVDGRKLAVDINNMVG